MEQPHPPTCKTVLQLPGQPRQGWGWAPCPGAAGRTGAKPASRAGKSGSVTWLEKSKRTACISENGKSDLDNESPVSLTSLAHGLGAHSEREIVQKWGKRLVACPREFTLLAQQLS